MASDNAMDTIKFLYSIGRLKVTERTGWVENAIPRPESVSDHMYRVALLCMMCPDRALNRDRLIRMALCHDTGESIIGDISPRMRVPKEEKYARERAAVAHLSGLLGRDSPLAAELSELWEEYEAQATPEAQFLKDMDILEMIVQAYEYEQMHPGKDLSSFVESGKHIKHPWARSILQTLPLFQKEECTAGDTFKGSSFSTSDDSLKKNVSHE